MPTSNDPSRPGLDAAVQEFLAATGPAPAAPKPRPAGPVAAAGPRRPTGRPAQAPAAERSLETAFDEVLKHEAAKRLRRDARMPAWRRAIPLVLALALLGTAAWILVGRPTWLYPREPVLTSPTRAPMARAYIKSAANLIEEYRQRTGRLPASLDELGVPLPQMGYARRPDGSYLITTALGTHLFELKGSAEGVAELRERNR